LIHSSGRATAKITGMRGLQLVLTECLANHKSWRDGSSYHQSLTDHHSRRQTDRHLIPPVHFKWLEKLQRWSISNQVRPSSNFQRPCSNGIATRRLLRTALFITRITTRLMLVAFLKTIFFLRSNSKKVRLKQFSSGDSWLWTALTLIFSTECIVITTQFGRRFSI
jgi:hypothetical protein